MHPLERSSRLECRGREVVRRQGRQIDGSANRGERLAEACGALVVAGGAGTLVERGVHRGRRELLDVVRQDDDDREVLRQLERLERSSRRRFRAAGRRRGRTARRRRSSPRPRAAPAGSSGSSSCAFASRSAVAASELPPPRPAATGTCFSIRTRQPCGAPRASSARRTIVSAGKPSIDVLDAGSIVMRSTRSIRWKTVTSSCLPSARCGPTTSARLIFAGAGPITARGPR